MLTTKGRKLIREGYRPYDPSSRTFWRRRNPGDNKRTSNCQGLVGAGGINRRSAEEFQGSENTLYNALVLDTCHYTFVQKHRTCSGVDASANYGLGWL